MMRALWTAASGMLNQQTNVDVISNNLANVNTTGFKKETTEFKSLLYQTIQDKATLSNGAVKPVSAQVGLGVRTAAITSSYTQGTLVDTGNDLDFAIEGDGFFKVKSTSGEILYTRNGSFKTALVEGGFYITNSEGDPVLDKENNPIFFTEDVKTSSITIGADGSLAYYNDAGEIIRHDQTFGLAQFQNAAGLEKLSGGLLRATSASGEAIEETADSGLKLSNLKQQYLEGSNVQVVDEMVNLIVAQRAYELNSKAIQSADTMLQQANQLKQ